MILRCETRLRFSVIYESTKQNADISSGFQVIMQTHRYTSTKSEALDRHTQLKTIKVFTCKGTCISTALFFCSTTVPHTQRTHTVHLRLHQCLPLPHKHSPDGASPD